MDVYIQWLFLATSFSCVFLGSWCMHVFTVQNAITEQSEFGLLGLEWLNFNFKDWLYLCAKIVALVTVEVETDS